MSEWYPYEEGATIGMRGTEGGAILIDEEHPVGARITLERDCLRAPYAITTLIYNWTMHTRFIADEPTAFHEYNAMKASLETDILPQVPVTEADDDYAADYEQLTAAFDQFIARYA